MAPESRTTVGGSPVFAEMAGIELHHLPTGHRPMFSRPAKRPDHAQ